MVTGSSAVAEIDNSRAAKSATTVMRASRSPRVCMMLSFLGLKVTALCRSVEMSESGHQPIRGHHCIDHRPILPVGKQVRAGVRSYRAVRASIRCMACYTYLVSRVKKVIDEWCAVLKKPWFLLLIYQRFK